ncbi:MAG: TetR/AcrR family transcriptional regulator [Furfurilactobacillus sp.]|jgi:AcrR family transcriptional regulator|uniref:TetR/AcrR family transcriptional regulator n=1 Tax=Furfurilactobacillus milii TaxID=2888272 RepID=A0ABT6D817_9LACO|nr:MULTISPECIES: TetR/AcrR family transcriptional regulator [Furfurilactobacillus]QLE65772.1 Transcriptional regulator TetR [Furfurilactobacillus rossiae]MCF6160316.1 TetR/AcrR family transcriptional regulator [Furfurilactobacillus milii]MCF6162259.1 TetR/AcrR family transcriptional regulator [Furfurilactobacillus milii]MCF6420128.1 TetR/AcrR family transcriptional regulator [Furfurilactobacillus milii]MCH4012296.1 TetR/AcrR family transcriptional regulator [Furfurilactobacillus sp.]
MRKDAQINQQKILNAAAKLFKERAVSTVSMKDIAQVAGIGTGTLYRNFPNKSELCMALSLDYIQQFITGEEAQLHNSASSVTKQFENFLTRWLEFRERRIQLLTEIETGPSVMSTFYHSPLYQQLVNLTMQALKPISDNISESELKFRADMLISMLKSDSYAYQREQGLTREQIAINISHLMIKRCD